MSMNSWLNELKWKTKTAFLKSHKGCIVLFTDETRSCQRHIDGRRRVCRRLGEQHAECCIKPATAYGGGSVMVWGGVSLTRKTPLVQIAGNLTTQRYVDEVLRPHVAPLAAAHGGAFVYLDDINASKLT